MIKICYDQGYNDITAVVVVFPHLCLWYVVYAQTWGVLALKNTIEPP